VLGLDSAAEAAAGLPWDCSWGAAGLSGQFALPSYCLFVLPVCTAYVLARTLKTG
jgi:hypothetical protein